MFYRTKDKDEDRKKNKVYIITNGTNLANIIKYSTGEKCTIVPVPVENENEFKEKFKSYIDYDKNIIADEYKSLEEIAGDLKDYSIISNELFEICKSLYSEKVEHTNDIYLPKEEYQTYQSFLNNKKIKSFNDEQIEEIRAEHKAGATYKSLKEKYKCSVGTISNIVKYKGAYKDNIL